MITNKIHIKTSFDIDGFVAFAAGYLGIDHELILVILPNGALLDRFSRDGYEYQALLYKNDIPGVYNLVVRPDVGAGIGGILAHEMVHLLQYATGRLWMNVNTGAAMWDGKIYSASVPYEERPWEKEAFKLQRRLERAWKKFNKSK